MSRTGAVYHFATPFDVFLVVTGCLLKFGFGVMQGFMLVIFSEFFDTGIDEFEEMSLFMLRWLCILGGISFFLEGGGTAFIDLSKNRQIAEWKKGYIKGVLRQEVAGYLTQELLERFAFDEVALTALLIAALFSSLVLAFVLLVGRVARTRKLRVVCVAATGQPVETLFAEGMTWNLFLSHIWSSAQDQAATIKRQLQLLVPAARAARRSPSHAWRAALRM